MSTYVPIQAITLSAATSSATFTGIPQTYTDLVVVISGTVSIADNVTMRFNGDSGSNYSWTYMAGTGSSAISGRGSNQTSILTAGFGTTTIANAIWQIQNYSNSTTNKTVLNRGNRSDDGVIAFVGLWRNTAAITSITVGGGAGNLNSGMTLTLYGVGSGSPKAFGGSEVRTDGTYWYHIFRSSGRFEPVESLTVDYLVVAGGGSGGSSGVGGGGGGAGGLRCTVGATGGGGSLEAPLFVTGNTSYTVTVGGGGAGATAGSLGNNGSNSVFGAITSTGGGGGSNGGSLNGVVGNSGGSGGGGAGRVSPNTGGAGTANQGYAGGNGVLGTGNDGGGGGGGAGALGSNGVNPRGGNGGGGVTTVIGGSTTSYSGGGGGGSGSGTIGGDGGSGGGGNGGASTGSGYVQAGVAGTVNTGGGSGGTRDGTVASNNGGSGIVIVRYLV